MIVKKTTLQNGHTVKIMIDECPETPRNWDNLAIMVFAGGKRHLGDKHPVNFNGYYAGRDGFIEQGAEDVRKAFKREGQDVAVILPVHFYEHGQCGISTSMTYPYNCKWDSGTIGFVVVTKQAIRENWRVKRVTQKYIDHAEEIAKVEVKTLSQWMNGEVYGYLIENENGDQVDSCWGFYGDDVQTNGMADYMDGKYVEALNAA